GAQMKAHLFDSDDGFDDDFADFDQAAPAEAAPPPTPAGAEPAPKQPSQELAALFDSVLDEELKQFDARREEAISVAASGQNLQAITPMDSEQPTLASPELP